MRLTHTEPSGTSAGGRGSRLFHLDEMQTSVADFLCGQQALRAQRAANTAAWASVQTFVIDTHAVALFKLCCAAASHNFIYKSSSFSDLFPVILLFIWQMKIKRIVFDTQSSLL